MSALESWEQEKQSVYLYRILAEVEPSGQRRALFTRLAKEADSQSEIWAAQAQESGAPVPSRYVPSARARIVRHLLLRLGPRRLRGVLSAMKVRGMSTYDLPDAGHPMPESLEDVGRRHRGPAGSGNLRAAVFGVNDGLLSNASLIAGISGATPDPRVIVLSGVAGLLAGAFSMASGEYISVRSQREMFEFQIAAERDELAQYPAEEAAELQLIYEARGIPPEDAARISRALIADPKHALDTLAREELGLDPATLGSPWGAAVSSFLSFAVGAVVPLLPFLIAPQGPALQASIGLTAASLFGVGAAISLFTGRHALWGGLRMLLIGAAAGAATFLIGRLLGVSAD